jgi:hypothetical protein
VEGVVLIYMDEYSADKLGQKWGDPVWDRDVYARLLDRLKDCHAKAVVFDVLFKTYGTNGQSFADALRAARKAGVPVILGGKREREPKPHGSIATSLLRPADEFMSLANWGLAETGPPPLRRHFLGEKGIPSLALRTAELTGEHASRPLSPERWINFYGPPGFLRHYSLYDVCDVLDPELTLPAAFSNNVCFVGGLNTGTPVAGGVLVDEWHTPYSRWGGGKTPGVELTATVYLNLVRGDWLTRLPIWGETLIVAIAGIVFGFGFVFCRPTLATGIGLAAAVILAGAACWWMWHSYVWFSWLVIVAVQIPFALVWSALAYTRRLTPEKGPAPDVTTVVTPGSSPSRPADRFPAIPDHTMLRCVGGGGYGEVWLARNVVGGYHAVKIVRRDEFDHPGPFEREFRGLEKFMPISRAHAGLVHVLHVGRRDEEGFIYYVMEAADDETTGAQITPDSYSPRNLATDLRRRGHLSAAEAVKLGLDLTDALEFLHQHGLIHRDIKPANIIFVNNKPKLADIGLVTAVAAPGADVTYVGTKGYIAPEGPGTPAADVYSLGKVLYETSMGLGREQFPELPNTLAQRPDHAALLELNKILLKACRQDPSQRYRTAADMRADILASFVVRPL